MRLDRRHRKQKQQMTAPAAGASRAFEGAPICQTTLPRNWNPHLVKPRIEALTSDANHGNVLGERELGQRLGRRRGVRLIAAGHQTFDDRLSVVI
jgi:hypothetical protein